MARKRRRTTRLVMLLACRGNLGPPPAFSALANGQTKGAGNADKGTRIGYMKKFGLVTD